MDRKGHGRLYLTSSVYMCFQGRVLTQWLPSYVFQENDCLSMEVTFRIWCKFVGGEIVNGKIVASDGFSNV